MRLQRPSSSCRRVEAAAAGLRALAGQRAIRLVPSGSAGASLRDWKTNLLSRPNRVPDRRAYARGARSAHRGGSHHHRDDDDSSLANEARHALAGPQHPAFRSPQRRRLARSGRPAKTRRRDVGASLPVYRRRDGRCQGLASRRSSANIASSRADAHSPGQKRGARAQNAAKSSQLGRECARFRRRACVRLRVHNVPFAAHRYALGSKRFRGDASAARCTNASSLASERPSRRGCRCWAEQVGCTNRVCARFVKFVDV